MECRKCGKILSEQEKFCTYCGYYNDPNEIDENLTQVELKSKTSEILNEHNKNLKEEFEDKSKFKIKCLKTFLANDYNNVITGSFNIYALIFSWIYFIYKKMYLIGITGLIIAGVLLLFEKIILIIYAVISMIISGLLFNKIYKWKAEKTITKILKKNNNPSQILKKVKQAGKENILMTLIIYFIFLMLLIFMYLKLGNDFGIMDKYWRENSNNKASCLSMIQTAKLQSNNNLSATLIEAGCVVVDSNSEQFEIYLNFDTTNQIIIEKYKIENDKMYFIGNTELLIEYENRGNNLNDSEIKYYQDMLEIKHTYTKIIQNSTQEESLIKNNSNITPRKYFILKKEEINR